MELISFVPSYYGYTPTTFGFCYQTANEKLLSEQAKIDELSDKAQDVAKVSGDGRVTSQASQISSRYQTALVNAKVKNLVTQFR